MSAQATVYTLPDAKSSIAAHTAHSQMVSKWCYFEGVKRWAFAPVFVGKHPLTTPMQRSVVVYVQQSLYFISAKTWPFL